MKNFVSKLQHPLRSIAFLGLAAQLLVAGPVMAANVLDNGFLRFGSGSEDSVNTSGNLQQPFYYNQSSSVWRKLTFSSRPLNQSFALGGDGTQEWNINGFQLHDPVMTGQTIDTAGFTPTDGGTKGYGTLVSTGTITIDGKDLEVSNTYELLANKSYITVTTKIKNISGVAVENLRVWSGTGDDYVGGTDSPTKQKGNLVSGAFEQIANATDRALAIQITSGAEGVLFFTNTNKANTILNSCCSFDSNIVPTNPANSVITTTNDGSYGFYVRLNDLANGASDQFSWYYAAGELADLAGIIGDVAAASGAVSNIDSNSATFKATTSADGTGYWVVVPRDATAPTEAQIKARANYAGVSVLASGSAAMTDSVEKSFAINGLQPGTDYDLYFVSEDAVPSFSSVVKAQFATIPYVAPVGAEAIPTLSEWALLILVALMGLFGITQLRQRKSA